LKMPARVMSAVRLIASTVRSSASESVSCDTTRTSGSTAAVLSVTLMGVTWGSMGRASQRARFRIDHLLRHWRYAAGLTTIAVFSAVLMQADKLILSKLVPLDAREQFVEPARR